MPRSNTIEALKVYRKRLGGKAAKRAIAHICGNDVAEAERLREFVSSLPGAWKVATAETLPEIRRRRARLAHRLKRASAALAKDIDFQHLTLLELRTDGEYQVHLLSSRANNRPTCSELIDFIADDVIRPRSYDGLTLDRKMSLRSYCLAAVHFRLASWPKFAGRRLPQRQAEALVGAMLNVAIANDAITHLLGKDGRRSYSKD